MSNHTTDIVELLSVGGEAIAQADAALGELIARRARLQADIDNLTVKRNRVARDLFTVRETLANLPAHRRPSAYDLRDARATTGRRCCRLTVPELIHLGEAALQRYAALRCEPEEELTPATARRPRATTKR